jgi:hypothetical protein
MDVMGLPASRRFTFCGDADLERLRRFGDGLSSSIVGDSSCTFSGLAALLGDFSGDDAASPAGPPLMWRDIPLDDAGTTTNLGSAARNNREFGEK